MLKTNRYVIAFIGVMFHLMTGSVCAWSVFTSPITKQNDWAESSVALASSIAIFLLGMSAALMGKVVEKIGPKLTRVIASFLYGTGTIMTDWVIHQSSAWLLYLSYGVIGGLGLGVGYVTPVPTIIKWSPDKRGLATGLAAMGFGFTAMLTDPVAQQLMANVGLEQTFYLLGTFYFAIVLLAAQFIVRPSLALSSITENSISQKKGARLTQGPELTANQALKTKPFTFLWIMFSINITCGIGLVPAASPMAQSMTGMSVQTAVIVVGIIGLFNGFGCLIWATSSDYIGRFTIFSAIFILDIVVLSTMLIFKLPFLFVIALCLLMSCYGAGFSVIPAYLGGVFDTKELGAVHGYVLTAWAAVRVVGPLLLPLIHQLFHNYTLTLAAFISINLLALLISFWIQRDFIKASRLIKSKS